MDIRTQLLTENDCYKAGRYITPRGIMVHSTGANNPKLSRYLPGDEVIGYNAYGNHWDKPGLDVCVHGFIGKDATGAVRAYQTLPWDMRGWHCGGAGNETHISFEICEDGLDNAEYFLAAYDAAAELCAFLCREYGIDPANVICHSEGAALGIASNHADVMHWFSRFGLTMDDFRAAVEGKLKEEDVMDNKGNTPSDWAEEACAWAKGKELINGDENGNMHWQEPVTREQLAVILRRAFGE